MAKQLTLGVYDGKQRVCLGRDTIRSTFQKDKEYLNKIFISVRVVKSVNNWNGGRNHRLSSGC